MSEYEAPCNQIMSDDERIALLWLREGNGQKYVDCRPHVNERAGLNSPQMCLVRALPGLEELGLVIVDPPQSSAQRVRLTLEGERTAWITTDPRTTSARNGEP